MASSTESSMELRDAAYLLEVFTAMPEFKSDWNALAVKHGVHIGTASRRFKAIAKRHGYKFENGKVTQDGDDAVAGGQYNQTPKKAKAKRALKGTPTPKKRKLSEATVKDEEDVLDAQNNLKAAEAGKKKLIEGGKAGSRDGVDEEDGHLNPDYQAGAKRVKM